MSLEAIERFFILAPAGRMFQRVEKSKSLLSDELQINWLSRNVGPAPLDWLHFGNSLAEVRQLGLPHINQRRSGVLTAIYQSHHKNLKAGVG
ncbi:MAG TPA: hypothetical protein VE054_01015 [Blattabacteriaceae bacterium]|nr:hypothetical protein [Blattabacteriaceae bacterium]